MHPQLEDVRESQHFRYAARPIDLLEIEGLVTAMDAQRRQAEPDDRPLPQPGVPRFVRTVFRELVQQVRVAGLTDELPQHHRALELALAVPVQLPCEVTLIEHGSPPTREHA